jgi:hypothetical protein
MTYPGDLYNFILSITTATGAAPSITAAPVITIVSLGTNTAIVSSQAMTVIAGTSNQVYTYNWNTTSLPDGDYIALVSYGHDGITINSELLQKVTLGDTFITGVVALDATVAKNATVALDATVAHQADVAAIDPDTSSVVLAIQAKTANLPSNPASTTDVTNLLALITQVSNAVLGTWVVNKTVSPNVLTFFNPDNSVLATFSLTDSTASSNRTRTD